MDYQGPEERWFMKKTSKVRNLCPCTLRAKFYCFAGFFIKDPQLKAHLLTAKLGPQLLVKIVVQNLVGKLLLAGHPQKPLLEL